MQSSSVSGKGRSLPGWDVAASCPVAAPRHKLAGGSAGHCWLFGVLSLRRLRQVPALVAVVEPAATAVPLQCNTEVVRSDRHSELPRQMIEDFVGGGALGMCLHSLQRRIAQRHTRRLWRAASGSALPAGRRRRRSCRTSSSASLAHLDAPAESRQHPLSNFQLIKLICQPCPFGFDPCQPFGNPLLLLANLVHRSHPSSPSSFPQYPTRHSARYFPINGGPVHRKKTARRKLLLFHGRAVHVPHCGLGGWRRAQRKSSVVRSLPDPLTGDGNSRP